MKVGVLQFFSWPERRVAIEIVYERALQRIEIMDRTGYDAVWLDQEHCGLTIEQLEQAACAARACGLDSFARLYATDYATVMRPLEAGVGASERMRAVAARLDHVVEEAGARRMGGGLDRCQPGVPDRTGRQSPLEVRVVRRRVLGVLGAREDRELARRVVQRGVELELDAPGEPVVEDPRDLAEVLGVAALGLHDAGQGEHLVPVLLGDPELVELGAL